MADEILNPFRKSMDTLTIVKDSIDEAKRYAKFVISTINPDRIKDVIVPKGGDLSYYKDNPVVFMEHGRTSPIPVGLSKDAAGNLDVTIFDDRIEAGVYFGTHPEGEVGWYCVKNDLIKGASIGADPKPGGREFMENGGTRYNSWIMREWSITARPMNSECWRKAADLPELCKSWLEKDAADSDQYDDPGDAVMPGEQFMKSLHDDIAHVVKTHHGRALMQEHKIVKSVFHNDVHPRLHKCMLALRKAATEAYGENHSLKEPEGLPKPSHEKSDTPDLLKNAAEALERLLYYGKPVLLKDKHSIEKLIQKMRQSSTVEKAATPTIDPALEAIARRFEKVSGEKVLS